MPTWTAGTKTFTATVPLDNRNGDVLSGSLTLGAWSIVSVAYMEAVYNAVALAPVFVGPGDPFPAFPAAAGWPDGGEFTIDALSTSGLDVSVTISYPPSFVPTLDFLGTPSYEPRMPGELFVAILHFADAAPLSLMLAVGEGMDYFRYFYFQHELYPSPMSGNTQLDAYDVPTGADFIASQTIASKAGTQTGTATAANRGVTLYVNNTTPDSTDPFSASIDFWAWSVRANHRGPFPLTTDADADLYPDDYFSIQQTDFVPLAEYAQDLDVTANAWDEKGRRYGIIEHPSFPALVAPGVVDAHGDLYSAAIAMSDETPVIRCATASKAALTKTVSNAPFGVLTSAMALDGAGLLWLCASASYRSKDSGVTFPDSAPIFAWPGTKIMAHMAPLPMGVGLGAITVSGMTLFFAPMLAAFQWPYETGGTDVEIATLTWGDERDDYDAPTRAFVIFSQEHDSASWLYVTDGCDFLFESTDFGDTWTAKTLGDFWTRPFDPALFGAVRFFPLSHGAYGAVAIEYATGKAFFARTWNGFTGWTSPQEAATLNDEFPVANACQLHLAHSGRIVLWNGGNEPSNAVIRVFDGTNWADG